MKFLFKEMIDVYKNDLAGEKHGADVGLVLRKGGESALFQTRRI